MPKGSRTKKNSKSPAEVTETTLQSSTLSPEIKAQISQLDKVTNKDPKLDTPPSPLLTSTISNTKSKKAKSMRAPLKVKDNGVIADKKSSAMKRILARKQKPNRRELPKDNGRHDNFVKTTKTTKTKPEPKTERELTENFEDILDSYARKKEYVPSKEEQQQYDEAVKEYNAKQAKKGAIQKQKEAAAQEATAKQLEAEPPAVQLPSHGSAFNLGPGLDGFETKKRFLPKHTNGRYADIFEAYKVAVHFKLPHVETVKPPPKSEPALEGKVRPILDFLSSKNNVNQTTDSSEAPESTIPENIKEVSPEVARPAIGDRTTATTLFDDAETDATTAQVLVAGAAPVLVEYATMEDVEIQEFNACLAVTSGIARGEPVEPKTAKVTDTEHFEYAAMDLPVIAETVNKNADLTEADNPLTKPEGTTGVSERDAVRDLVTSETTVASRALLPIVSPPNACRKVRSISLKTRILNANLKFMDLRDEKIGIQSTVIMDLNLGARTHLEQLHSADMANCMLRCATQYGVQTTESAVIPAPKMECTLPRDVIADAVYQAIEHILQKVVVPFFIFFNINGVTGTPAIDLYTVVDNIATVFLRINTTWKGIRMPPLGTAGFKFIDPLSWISHALWSLNCDVFGHQNLLVLEHYGLSTAWAVGLRRNVQPLELSGDMKIDGAVAEIAGSKLGSTQEGSKVDTVFSNVRPHLTLTGGSMDTTSSLTQVMGKQAEVVEEDRESGQLDLALSNELSSEQLPELDKEHIVQPGPDASLSVNLPSCEDAGPTTSIHASISTDEQSQGESESVVMKGFAHAMVVEEQVATSAEVQDRLELSIVTTFSSGDTGCVDEKELSPPIEFDVPPGEDEIPDGVIQYASTERSSIQAGDVSGQSISAPANVDDHYEAASHDVMSAPGYKKPFGDTLLPFTSEELGASSLTRLNDETASVAQGSSNEQPPTAPEILLVLSPILHQDNEDADFMNNPVRHELVLGAAVNESADSEPSGRNKCGFQVLRLAPEVRAPFVPNCMHESHTTGGSIFNLVSSYLWLRPHVPDPFDENRLRPTFLHEETISPKCSAAALKRPTISNEGTDDKSPLKLQDESMVDNAPKNMEMAVVPFTDQDTAPQSTMGSIVQASQLDLGNVSLLDFLDAVDSTGDGKLTKLNIASAFLDLSNEMRADLGLPLHHVPSDIDDLLASRHTMKKIKLGNTKLTDLLIMIEFGDDAIATDAALCKGFKAACEKERALIERVGSRVAL